jgi:hypothetical protein
MRKTLLCLLLGIGIVCFANAGALALSFSSPDISASVVGSTTPNFADGNLKLTPDPDPNPGPLTILFMGFAFLCLAGAGRRPTRNNP